MFNKPNVNTLWAEGGQVIFPGASKVSQGWVSEIPDFEFENWIQNRQDAFNAHVNQFGVPLWDATTSYLANKSYVQGSDGVIYQALTDNQNKNPTINPSDWVEIFAQKNLTYSKVEADSRFLRASLNLSDLTNTTTARNNLSVYSKVQSDLRYFGQDLEKSSETISVTSGQSVINLTQIQVSSQYQPEVYFTGYSSYERLFDFTVTSNSQITLGTATPFAGSIVVVNNKTQGAD